MLVAALKRYRIMILASIFFFYLGCGITLSLLRIECADGLSSVNSPIANSLSDNRLSSKLDKVEYAVLILTSPNNEAKRDAIRTTWANFINNIITENDERLFRWNYTWSGQYTRPEFVRFFFVVGTQGLGELKLAKLQEEHRRSNDLLFLDHVADSYKNLATKLLESLKWLHENLRGLRYVVKCDDDSFVRIDLIIRDLEAYAPNMDAPKIKKYITFKGNYNTYNGLYWGYFDGRAHVYLQGKWQEEDWFLCDNYLPYALGGGYVISQNIVSYIARNADMLSHYNSEDVSMGVWTAALSSINRVHDVRFDTEWKSRGCQNDLLVRHKQAPNDMFQMYTVLVHSQGRSLCKSETVDRKSYSYKWNVLPSMCCK